MATVVRRATLVVPREPARAKTTAAPRRARKSIADWSDREAGIAAVAVIAALGLVLLLIVGGIVLYATTWGYAVSLG